jgi:hypothetical protein
MSFDDSSKFLGSSARLRPDAFRSKPPATEFKCLMCRTPMNDKGKHWECPRCFFFYRPLAPGTIPKRYGGRPIKRMCLQCRRRQISADPRQKLCARCAEKRERDRKAVRCRDYLDLAPSR